MKRRVSGGQPFASNTAGMVFDVNVLSVSMPSTLPLWYARRSAAGFLPWNDSRRASCHGRASRAKASCMALSPGITRMHAVEKWRRRASSSE